MELMVKVYYGVDADQANRWCLTTTVWGVGAGVDDGGDGGSYRNRPKKNLLVYLCAGSFETFSCLVSFLLTCAWLVPCPEWTAVAIL